jgi:WD40 repeat protein
VLGNPSLLLFYSFLFPSLTVGEPLEGHTKSIWSVTYFPDGRYIVSGSWDKTPRIWAARSGAAVGKPLKGHTGEISSIAYSPDGQRIVSVSGSRDNTLRIWDAETGAAVGEPLEVHTGAVFSAAHSLDGRPTVCGATENTISMWPSFPSLSSQPSSSFSVMGKSLQGALAA